MKRLGLAILLLATPPALPPDAPGRANALAAEAGDPSAKEAFEAAKELGTVEAWEAFLARYSSGFYADLARAYVKKLAGGSGPPAPSPATPASAPPDRPPRLPAREAGAPPPPRGTAETEPDVAPTDPSRPAVARGGRFFGFAERFNRYYTDPAWTPSRTVFVSPQGRGDGSARATPMAARDAVAGARPGTRIVFLRGSYGGCFEFSKETSGTYDQPIVLTGERNPDGTLGVKMTCCTTGRQTCFNMEGASHVAVDGFELVGGLYGVRLVGTGYDASEHSQGIAVIDCYGHDQERDPFKSNQADWAVFERNVGANAKAGDGHGIYISGGSDWNIVRFNETFGGTSSDFQINADPTSACQEEKVAFDDPRCDAWAGDGEGGRGASDYILVDGNYFHHSGGPGANFTSVRRSLVRNNIFGPHARHNTSFWQETDNPKLASRENRILHNLFVTTGRHGLQFINGSGANEVANNVFLGVKLEGGRAAANPAALLMGVDGSVGDNTYRGNLYVSGRLEGREVGPDELARPDFLPAWFARFPTARNRDPADYRPAPGSPLLGAGRLLPDAPADRAGVNRTGAVDLGPIEVP